MGGINGFGSVYILRVNGDSSVTFIPITEQGDVETMADAFGGTVQYSNQGHLKVPAGTFDLSQATSVLKIEHGDAGPISSTLHCVEGRTFEEAVCKVAAVMGNANPAS